MKPAALNPAYWSCRWVGRAGSRLQTESNVPVESAAQPRTIPVLPGPLWGGGGGWGAGRKYTHVVQEVKMAEVGFGSEWFWEGELGRGYWAWLRCWINHRDLPGGRADAEAGYWPDVGQSDSARRSDSFWMFLLESPEKPLLPGCQWKLSCLKQDLLHLSHVPHAWKYSDFYQPLFQRIFAAGGNKMVRFVQKWNSYSLLVLSVSLDHLSLWEQLLKGNVEKTSMMQNLKKCICWLENKQHLGLMPKM